MSTAFPIGDTGDGPIFSTCLGPTETQILNLYRELEVTQWWTAEQLRQWQFSQLSKLVAHASEHVPFYAEILTSLRKGADESIDEAAWRSLPLLTKQQVRTEGARLRSQ